GAEHLCTYHSGGKLRRPQRPFSGGVGREVRPSWRRGAAVDSKRVLFEQFAGSRCGLPGGIPYASGFDPNLDVGYFGKLATAALAEAGRSEDRKQIENHAQAREGLYPCGNAG